MSWEKRVLNGCIQYREVTEGGKGKWQFQVLGFEYMGVKNDCRVLGVDGFVVGKMDNNHNLTVNGKKYGPRHWNH